MRGKNLTDVLDEDPWKVLAILKRRIQEQSATRRYYLEQSQATGFGRKPLPQDENWFLTNLVVNRYIVGLRHLKDFHSPVYLYVRC